MAKNTRNILSALFILAVTYAFLVLVAAPFSPDLSTLQSETLPVYKMFIRFTPSTALEQQASYVAASGGVVEKLLPEVNGLIAAYSTQPDLPESDLVEASQPFYDNEPESVAAAANQVFSQSSATAFFIPSATPGVATLTLTFTHVPTSTRQPTSTRFPTGTPPGTIIFQPTSTFVPTTTLTAQPSSTPVPTSTPAPSATLTPIHPSVTVFPTNTPWATSTPAPSATSTPIRPSVTVRPMTNTPRPTNTIVVPSRTPYDAGPPTPTQLPDYGLCETNNNVIQVSTFNDENDYVCTVNHCSIREAVACSVANGGLDIFIPGGQYTLTSGSVMIPASMSLIGAGEGVTIIDAGTSAHTFEVLQGATVSMNNMSLRHGNSVVYNWGDLTLTNVTVENGLAQNGGGIYNAIEGDLLLDHVRVSDNAAQQNGGGVYNLGKLEITDSVIQNNQISAGTVANRRGAGVYNQGTGEMYLVIEGSSFINNTGADQGGGLFTGTSNTRITNSTISGNQAFVEGGGIAHHSNGEDDGHFYLRHVTVTLNRAPDGGGTAYLGAIGGPVQLVNSILAGNTDLDGNREEFSESVVVIARSIVGGTEDEVVTFESNQVIRTDDPGLLPLQQDANGTFSHPLAGNSPAIDAASSANCEENDQQGIIRPQGFGCDIGAVEYIADDSPDLSPQPNRLETQTPLLTWGWIDWAVAYEIQIDNNRDFNSLEFQKTINPGSTSVTTTPLENGQYYWRVRAQREDGGWGSWSAISTFVISWVYP